MSPPYPLYLSEIESIIKNNKKCHNHILRTYEYVRVHEVHKVHKKIMYYLLVCVLCNVMVGMLTLYDIR